MKICYAFYIPGKPVTKKNSMNVVYVGKKCPVCHKGQRAIPMKSKAYQKYEKVALAALELQPIKRQIIDVPCNVQVVYNFNKNKDGSMPKKLPDLTNLLEATDDILVAAKILSDDNCGIIQSHDGSRVFFNDGQEEGCYVQISFDE